jgi:quinol monooxygenase YgiN
MSSQAIYTFAKWRVKPKHLETVKNLLAELAVLSTAEPGNLVYKAYQSKSEEDILILFEGYRDESALFEHRSSEHYQNLVLDRVIPLLEEREITVTNRL